MHLNPRPMIAELSIPMLHAADGISQQIKGECFIGVMQRRFDYTYGSRVDLGGLMPHVAGGVPHRMEDVLRSELDSLHPGIGLEAVGLTVPVAQGLVDGMFDRVRGECFDLVAQSNQGFIQQI